MWRNKIIGRLVVVVGVVQVKAGGSCRNGVHFIVACGIGVTFTIKGIEPEKELDSNIRRNLFLIFKEAINNIAKHSNAINVNVSIEKNRNELIMTIEDNGTKNKTNNAGSGQGLTNMNMRANDIGAELNIVNDNGYKITLTIKNFVWT